MSTEDRIIRFVKTYIVVLRHSGGLQAKYIEVQANGILNAVEEGRQHEENYGSRYVGRVIDPETNKTVWEEHKGIIP